MSNIRFCGFGGQGILLSGYIFGAAAVIDGHKTLQTQSYGSESRGGGCRSDVIISKDEIYELSPSNFDVLVVLSQAAYNTYSSSLKEDGILLVDEDMVVTGDKSPARTYRIKAADIAHRDFGNKIMANMVMMGFIAAMLDVVSKEALKQAIINNMSEELAEKNLQAFEAGYVLGDEVQAAEEGKTGN